MRATLADASLARYAGRFVWLELDFDKTENQVFLQHHGVLSTPSFFILDSGERAVATQFSAMSLPEVSGFLERGEKEALAANKSPAEAALSHGDELLAKDRLAEAADAYRLGIRLAGDNRLLHEQAIGSLTWTLMLNSQWQLCAETAATQAPQLARSPIFGRVVLAGLMCVNQDVSASWAQASEKILKPLAAEAITLPVTVRDHQFQLYQNLMYSAEKHHDAEAVKMWGDRWLKEIDAAKPASEDEQSALDIARVDAASIMGDPFRVLPALIASEKAMPTNYNASLRLAQMESAAKHYDEAIAACNRGLDHVTGPLGRSWLLQIKADALTQQGKPAESHKVLQEALSSAQAIPATRARENNIKRISQALKTTEDKN